MSNSQCIDNIGWGFANGQADGQMDKENELTVVQAE